MKIIIALRGKANSGKSQTVKILHNVLSENDFELVRSNLRNDTGDFIAIFKKNGKLIGITSCGDLYDLVFERLEELINEGCKICVCACRTYDRVPPGTNAAVTSFPGYEHQFIEKTLEDKEDSQESINRKDARKLFDIIERLLQNS